MDVQDSSGGVELPESPRRSPPEIESEREPTPAGTTSAETIAALSREIHETLRLHERHMRELASSIRRVVTDFSLSDERVAAVETSLLRDRDESNRLITYLETVFERLTMVDARLTELFERIDVTTDRSDFIDARLLDLTERDDRVEQRFGKVATVNDIGRIRESLDDLRNEHVVTRDLATNATALSMALAERVDENDRAARDRIADQSSAIRAELDEAIAAERASHAADKEHLESRISDLPTIDDMLTLSEEVDVRLAPLAPKSMVSEARDAIEARMAVLATADDVGELSKSVSELAEKHSRTRTMAFEVTSLTHALSGRMDAYKEEAKADVSKRVSVVRAELHEAIKASAMKDAAETKKLEIRISTLPRTEDVEALSARMDDHEMQSALRAAKQLSELRDEVTRRIDDLEAVPHSSEDE